MSCSVSINKINDDDDDNDDNDCQVNLPGNARRLHAVSQCDVIRNDAVTSLSSLVTSCPESVTSFDQTSNCHLRSPSTPQ